MSASKSRSLNHSGKQISEIDDRTEVDARIELCTELGLPPYPLPGINSGKQRQSLPSLWAHCRPDTFAGNSFMESRKLSCWIIGETSLAIRCANHLIERGHRLIGVISNASELQKWASSRQILIVPYGREMVQALASEPFDLLFSVFNRHILDAETLAFARLGGINYHDAPLPKYCGLHATSWALLGQEENYGITWHWMTSVADAGPILIQRQVSISPKETALSLNLKCMEAAAESFVSLVHQFEQETPSGSPQDETQRSWFERFHRPPNGGLLSWHEATDNADALVRCLDFGSRGNPLAMPGLIIGKNFYGIGSAEVKTGCPETSPGTLSELAHDKLTITFRDGWLRLRELVTATGRTMSVQDLVNQHGLVVGQRLPDTTKQHPALLKAIDALASRSEGFWNKRLSTLSPLTLAGLTGVAQKSSDPEACGKRVTCEWLLPLDLSRLDGVDSVVVATAAIAAFLACLHGKGSFDLAVPAQWPESISPPLEAVPWAPAFSPVVNLRVHLHESTSFRDIVAAIAEERSIHRKRGVFRSDLIGRTPDLHANGDLEHGISLPIRIVTAETPLLHVIDQEPDLLWSISRDGRRVTAEMASCWNHALVDALNGFRDFVVDLFIHPDKLLIQNRLPSQQLSSLERQKLLAWSRGEERRVREGFVHDWILSHEESLGRHTALEIGGLTLNYRDLQAKIKQMSTELSLNGISEGSVVALLLNRSLDLYVVMLAIMKAGAAYLPLDPQWPAQRIEQILAQLPPNSTLISQREVRRLGGGWQGRQLDIDELNEGQTTQLISACGDSCGQLAYVIFTSGSTGLPKGVEVKQIALANYIYHACLEYSIAPEDRVLQFHSPAFDASVEEIFIALTAGATLVGRSQEMLDSPRQFLKEVGQQQLSVLILPTAFWSQLVTEMMHEHLEMPECVRLVVIGGERVSLSQVLLWRRLTSSSVRLVNSYGPTETTVVATWHELGCSFPEHYRNLEPERDPPIGRPVPNVSTWVLDPEGRLCAVGVPGELHIGGAGVARGYLGQPALSAEKFIPLPFGLDEQNSRSECVYRTGDQVAWNSDGTLQYIGRLDRQIKLRGFRIEPREIEYVLELHPGVDTAVVVVDAEDAACARLIAYWKALPGQKELPTESVLRLFLQRQLPSYMQPATFVRLSEFPLSSSGKVDLRALPVLAGLKQVAETVENDHSQVEIGVDPICTVWRDLLRKRVINQDDNFFQIGADSLTAAAAAGRLSGILERDISASMIFLNPTIRRLRDAISRLSHEWLPSLEVLPRNQDLLVSPSQERLWNLIHSSSSYNHAYHLQVALTLRAGVDLDVLNQALSFLIQRHEILRTTFHGMGFGQPPVMRVHQAWKPELVVIPLAAESDIALQQQLQAAVGELSRKPFDLEQLPLVRWLVASLPNGSYMLLQCEHHLVHDGWTLHLLIKDICDIYEALSCGKIPETKARSLEFAEAASWQRRYLDARRSARQVDYWQKSLSGVPMKTEIPTDRLRPQQEDFSGAAIERLLSADAIRPLRSFCQEMNVTLFDGMFAIFAILIKRLSGQSDLCIGSGVANRRLGEMESVAGMFVNNIALRLIFSEDDTLATLVAQVSERKHLGLENQDLPFENVVRAVNPQRQPNLHPLFQMMFSFHDSPFPELQANSVIEGHASTFNNSSAKFDLNLICIPQQVGPDSEGIIVWWEYATTLFDRERIEGIIDIYEHLVTLLPLRPHSSVDTLPIIPPRHEALLCEWEMGSVPPLPDATLSRIFEKQALSHPEAVALVASGKQLTYDELNRRANQLAHRLIEEGVLPNDLIALSLERSPEMVIAMLAIIKSGAAYLPIDPDTPSQRVVHILGDAGAALILTNTSAGQRLNCSTPALYYDLLCLVDQPEISPSVWQESSSLAYVNYTSGSTGQPKGVLIEQRSVVRLVQSNEAFAIHSSDVCLQLAPLAFDAATLEIWGALLNGACLILSPPGPLSLPDLAATLKCHGVSSLWLTAGLFNAMVDEQLDALAGVRQVLAGGDILSPSHVQRLLEAFRPGYRLINGYGPTECTTFTCCHVMNAGERVSPLRIPIGKPIPYTTVYVLDVKGNRCPIGVIGELHIGGLGLARGYLHNSRLTDESFIPDPFSDDSSARLYRSGDLASWNPDGTLAFHGRIDQQVKLRGYRIEPGEIEASLMTHPAVAQAAVILWREDPSNPRLIAYWVPQPSDSLQGDIHIHHLGTADELRSHLSGLLPDYMVPSGFVQLQSLPLTANGKLDYQALPAPSFASDPQQRVEPSLDLERHLHSLWVQVLGHGDFGITDNFFQAGGHSLAASRLASRIEESLQVSLPMTRIFEAQTIAQQASLLNQTTARADHGSSEILAHFSSASPLQIDL